MLSTVLHPSCGQARAFPSVSKARIPDTVQPSEEKREERRMHVARSPSQHTPTSLAPNPIASAQC